MKLFDTTSTLAVRDAGRIDGISAVLLSGEPGTGKTRWAKLIAQSWADTFISYQCHEGTGKEEMFCDMDIAGVIERLSPHSDGGNGNGYVSKGLLPLACEASQKGKVVLLFDEIEKGRMAVDNMLLSFLQDGKVFVPHVGEFVAKMENIIFVATTNEQRLLSEPLYRRMRRLHIPFPSADELFTIVKSMVNADDFQAVGHETCRFLVTLAMWSRSQDVIKKITAPEIARLIGDLAALEDKKERLTALFSWFSPHREDWEILSKFNAGGVKYLEGMMKKL